LAGDDFLKSPCT